jgi:uncharacterized protein
VSALINFHLHNNNFLLTKDRTIFWEEEKILLVSDLHLGKAGHFRKAGIGIPQTIFKEDMQRLVSQLQYFKPAQLLVVGDLFHSTDNKEHELFLKWRKDLRGISIQLVKGNHDILEKEWYQEAGIEVHAEELQVNGFLFTHDIQACKTTQHDYCFSGHIHPGIKMKGMGRQTIQLPCFYFGKKYAVLPAFGKFTGTYPVKPMPGDRIFALVEDSILQIQ